MSELGRYMALLRTTKGKAMMLYKILTGMLSDSKGVALAYDVLSEMVKDYPDAREKLLVVKKMIERVVSGG